MSLAKKCDRCGKLYVYYQRAEVGYRYNAIEYCWVDANGYFTHEHLLKDLCPKCLDAFAKFMAMEENDG